MSKLSFRARALDASKPLPVFRCEDLPDLHEYASINRAVPQMPTGMEKEEESRGAPRRCLRKLVQNGRHYLAPFFPLRSHDGSRANTAFREPAPPREPPRGRAGTISDALAGLCPAGFTRNRAREHKAESRDSRRLHHFVDFLCGYKASGNGPRTRCTFRERVPGGDSEPPPGSSTHPSTPPPPARFDSEVLRVDSSGSAMCAAHWLHARSPSLSVKKSRPPAALPLLFLLYAHTAALHNRVTLEIKRTVLLHAWLSSLTHIPPGNNGELAE
ncbi:Enhancer of polycomb 1 [Liparis tanakae]|uniref:Enhancer of polycomb 1 n=1 Tax=Liparis tanakae TaxID=230148 RepID=A0A4Z2EW69_9TELE|nr:Enhancer of polycomb 1 [Liparis tanakae]